MVLLALLVTLGAATVTSRGEQRSPADRPWPPGVLAGRPADSRPLSPEEALETFHLAPGYRVELVASEPLVQDPVAIDWDPDGRLWVVEMPGYMRDIAGRDEHDPIGRVVVLEDRDGDGKMDRRTVFADRLVMARAVKVLDRGVLVGEPPHLWLMRDTDGDLRADTKALVTDATTDGVEIDPQNNANALDWALDNWMHMAGQVDIALRLKRGAFEVRRTLRRGQWGVTHDDSGRIYRNSNESALHVDVVPTAYFARHPNLLRTRGSYERLADDNPDLNVVWPVRRTPGLNRAYQFGILREDGSLARYHGGVRAARVSRRSPAVRAVRQRVRGRASRERREPDRRQRRRDDDPGAEGVRARRIPGVDRRALPAGLSRQCARRHDHDCRHVSRDSRAPALDDRVSARSDSSRGGWSSRPGMAGSIASCTRRTRRDTSWRDSGRSLKNASPADLAPRCRIRTAGGATRRSG